MDDASLRALRSKRYNELARDPSTLRAMMRMASARTHLDLLNCIFPDIYTQVLVTVADSSDNTSRKPVSELMSTALREATENGCPLSALPEGLTRTFEDAFGGRLGRADTRSYDKVVLGLSPPQYDMVLPSDPSQWPGEVGPIEYVYAGNEDFQESGADQGGVEHYTRLLRQLVTQGVVSARRSRTPRAGAAPFVCVLNDSEPDAFTVSQSKQDLLRALNGSQTAAEFYRTLLRDNQCPDAAAIVEYLEDEDRSKRLNDQIETKLMSQLFSILSYPSYIDPCRIGKPDLALTWGPEADNESDDGRDSEMGEGGEDSEDEADGDGEVDSECDCGDCVEPEAVPPAFSRYSRLRHETSRWPPGGVGRRDMTHVGGLPIAYNQLAKALNSIAATWLCDEMRPSTETEGSLESKIKVVKSMNSATKSVEQVWTDVQRELEEARERGAQKTENTESDRSLETAIRQEASTSVGNGVLDFSDGSPVMLLKGLHSSDSDRHPDAISFLRSMSQKMLNGWQSARIARLDVTGGAFERLRSTSKGTDEPSSESAKRGRSAREGSADRESKRTKSSS